jgi:hypothetical protein
MIVLEAQYFLISQLAGLACLGLLQCCPCRPILKCTAVQRAAAIWPQRRSDTHDQHMQKPSGGSSLPVRALDLSWCSCCCALAAAGMTRATTSAMHQA